MVLYRRNRVEGGCYFFTVTLRDRSSDLLIRHVGHLRNAFVACREDRPFTVDAVVIMPDHLHTIWTLPDGDSDYPGRWKAIKSHLTRSLRKDGVIQASPWQARYWEHTLRDDLDWRRHMDYIHYNPVKHGFVTSPCDWKYSSFRRCVEEGLYVEGWGEAVSREVMRMSLE
jgi:putative transposase